MNVLEAIRRRRTIRAYRPDPVPTEVIRQILDSARYTASWGNTQPWEFIVFQGKTLEAVQKGIAEKAASGALPKPDIPPPSFPDELRERTRQLSSRLYGSMGIPREDADRREGFRRYGDQFFGAPAAILILLDRSLGPWAMLDIGMVMQSIMLVALDFGLGSSPLFTMVRYPDVLRRVLAVPDSHVIVIGIALGYPEEKAPQNVFERLREPLDKLVRWVQG